MSAREKLRNSLQAFRNFWKRSEPRGKNQIFTPFETDKPWLDLQFHTNREVVKIDEIENKIDDPPDPISPDVLDKIQGSLVGLALGDALGAHVEFRPREYLVDHPVNDLEEGGTWGLKKGQFTDDTSMALCLANSLVSRHGFVPYDQLVRYKWWYQHGYMSSTGRCFDIGAATKESLDEFIQRQIKFGKRQRIPEKHMDYLSDRYLIEQFPVDCSKPGVAGNGALMRLAPVPLFFHNHPEAAVQYSGCSGYITHGDRKAYDACRYLGALIVAIFRGYSKSMLLDKHFYEKHKADFGGDPLCDEIKAIAEGSYQKKGGYDDGIRGKGYIVYSLEAALWAFWSDSDSFEKGVLAAINLGDDTDTTAAIYGQLAGAYYGYRNLPQKWVDQVYAKKYLLKLSKWLAYEGQNWKQTEVIFSWKEASLVGARCHSADNLLSCNPIAPPPPPRHLSRERSSSERAPTVPKLEIYTRMSFAPLEPLSPPPNDSTPEIRKQKKDGNKKQPWILSLSPFVKRKHQQPQN